MNPKQGVTACGYKQQKTLPLFYFLFLHVCLMNTYQLQELHIVK
jgi:uncharacterized membrane protein YadS